MPRPEYPRYEDRAAVLREAQRLKMTRSAHAYVRGSTLRFYEWLETSSGGKVPDGPAIWICGDCHSSNLGPVAGADGKVAIQIRDLDQTVIGNPAHDLIRLGLSLAMAARGSNLPGVTTALMVEQLVDGYQSAFQGRDDPAAPHGMPKEVRRALKSAVRRRWKHLARERIEDVRPAIPLGKRFWPLSDEERAAIVALGQEEDVRQLVTSLHHRPDAAEVEILDAAYWMKGCSSLGRLRYAVLAGLGQYNREQFEPCLLDIKEATTAAAPRASGALLSKDKGAPGSQTPRDNAERVVAGARALSPFLGERMLACRLLGRPVVLRELTPQDLKLEIDRISQPEALRAARYLAGVVGRAHARQMDDATRGGWLRELGRNRSRTLDAPDWLWSSLVELIISHEAAYLDHCRRYALDQRSAA